MSFVDASDARSGGQRWTDMGSTRKGLARRREAGQPAAGAWWVWWQEGGGITVLKSNSRLCGVDGVEGALIADLTLRDQRDARTDPRHCRRRHRNYLPTFPRPTKAPSRPSPPSPSPRKALPLPRLNSWLAAKARLSWSDAELGSLSNTGRPAAR